MKKIMLFLTIVIFCTSVYSSQGEFAEYRHLTLAEIENVDYQVVLRNENDDIILVIIEGEVFYVDNEW